MFEKVFERVLKLSRKFHINKHGIPAVCNYPIAICPFGDESKHFESYEDAEEYINLLNKAVKGETDLIAKHPSQKIRSYYTSIEAINEFIPNRKVAEIEDFELIIISWLAKGDVKENMKHNQISEAKFTYGDIVRVIEEELKLQYRYKDGLNLEDKYYNPVPFPLWEEGMRAQRNLYRDMSDNLAKELNFEKMSIIYLPMSARLRLEQDGFMSNAENLHEVIYHVEPAISQFGDIISYNHTTGNISKEFDIYEIAGVMEGKTLYDLCYDENIESKFNKIWNSSSIDKDEIDYKAAIDRYKDNQLFKGLEGPAIPRAFVRMSPIVAKEISEFMSTYRAIIIAIGDIIDESGVKKEIFSPKLEDEDWIID